MDLDDVVTPEGKKALLVIHEEDMKEDNSGRCAYLETADHQRVLASDINLLERYGAIIISNEEKRRGIYLNNEDKIPPNANALFVVGKIKDKSNYMGIYCILKEKKE